MNKDLKDMLKELKKSIELMEKLENNDFKGIKNKMTERLEKSLNEPCTISIEKDKTGKAKILIEGERLALLITFIGLKSNVLKKLHCSKEELEFLENFVGSEEVKNG